MDALGKMPDPKTTDPKKIQALVGIGSKTAVSGAATSGHQRGPARSATPVSTSNILRDQPDEARPTEEAEESLVPRKRQKTTEVRHGIGKETRNLAPPVSTDALPAVSMSEMDGMTPEELHDFIMKSSRATRLAAKAALNRIVSPSAALEEHKETIVKLTTDIEKQKAKINKLDERRVKLESDLRKARDDLSQALKDVSDRDAGMAVLRSELAEVKLELEGTKAELVEAVKARSTVQSLLDELTTRAETAKQDFLNSKELEDDLTLLMTQGMKGGFTMAIDQVKEVDPNFDVSAIAKPYLYDLEAIPRYGRYFAEFKTGVSLYKKYVTSVLSDEGTENVESGDQIDPNASTSNQPDA